MKRQRRPLTSPPSTGRAGTAGRLQPAMDAHSVSNEDVVSQEPSTTTIPAVASFRQTFYDSTSSSRTSLTSTSTLRPSNHGQYSGQALGSSASSMHVSDRAPLMSHGRSQSTATSGHGQFAVVDNFRRASAPVPYGGSRLRKMFATPQPFLEAAKAGATAEVQSQINSSNLALVDKDDWTALHYAAAYGSFDTVKLLLRYYSYLDPRTKRQDRTPLFLAVQAGHLRIAEALIDAGANVTAAGRMDGATPLHRAALEGDEAMTQMLLRCGASVTVRDIEGMQPLLWAVQGGNARVAELLVQAGAPLEERTQTSGLTALHRAVSTKNEAMVKALLQLGANANADAPLGIRCLHRAAMAGSGNLVQLIVCESTVEIDARTAKGWTPLHCAARNGHRGICATLLSAGAEKEAVNRKGLTAELLARKWGFENIV